MFLVQYEVQRHPAEAPLVFSPLCVSMVDVFPDVASGDVEASFQGVRQAISLAVTLGVALLGGLIVGELLEDDGDTRSTFQDGR